MGLLEKATSFAGQSETAPAAERDDAIFGLRARAEMLRSRAAPVPAPVAAAPTAAAAETGGVEIFGLRARAEAMREAIPPLPESAGMGLLARAQRMRAQAPAPRLAPTPAPAEATSPVPAASIAESAAPAAPASAAPILEPSAPAAIDPQPAAVNVPEPIDEPASDSGEPEPEPPGLDDAPLEFADEPFESVEPTEDPVLAFDEAHESAEVGDVPEQPAEDPVLSFDDTAEPAPPAADGPAIESPAPEVESLAETPLDAGEAGLEVPASGSREEEALVFDQSDLESPDAAEPRGLLERADRMRTDDSDETNEADQTDDSPIAAESGVELEPAGSEIAAGLDSDPEPALADPRFDDLLPEDHVPVAPPVSETPEPADEGNAAASASDAPLPELVDPTEDTAHLVHDELRDFDAFLDREIIPEDLEPAPAPGEAAEPAAVDASDVAGADALFADEDYDEAGAPPAAPEADSDAAVDLEPRVDADGLPQLPYQPPGADADPARDPEGGPNLEEDPFGLWEQDAEREAEEQARQLELRGEVPGAAESADGDGENLLFEVDEGFTTAPVEAHIASQKKIDHYLSLFDITKEISNISEFDELWENILYAIMGQVGAETICILSSTQRVSSGAIFYPVAHSGFELPEGWALKRGDAIYDQTAAASGVRYAEEFLNSLQNPISPLERRILENTKAQIVVPLKNMGQMFGIVILGGQVSGDDYTIDDLEFLTLLGEIAAVGVDRVLSRIEFERDTEELRRRNMVHGSMFSLARRASGVKSLDEMYDILTRHLREDFSAQSFSLVLLSPRDRKYRIFAGNEISPASIERFALDVNSELVATISNLVRVYDLKDFRENREIASCYTNDDIGLMQHYWIVPLINMNWLVGFITVHRTDVSWTEFHRELMVTAAEIVSPVFANCIIMGERESLFRDPFSPLETRLTQELERSDQFRSPLSLVDIRVKNIRRLLELNPGEEVTAFLMALNRSIASALFETDFMARVGQGRFALILPGRARAEAEIFVKKLKAEFKRLRLLPASAVDIQYAHQIISAPADADQAGKMLSIFE